MRFFSIALLFAAAVAALPQAETAESDLVAIKAKAAEASFGHPAEERSVNDLPALDARIDSHEAEGRSVNLSPQNNARDGLLPRACTGKCECTKGLTPGLYCGYCTSPKDAVKSCRSGACMDQVYQCAANGDCCTYGKRTSCVNRQGPCRG